MNIFPERNHAILAKIHFWVCAFFYQNVPPSRWQDLLWQVHEENWHSWHCTKIFVKDERKGLVWEPLQPTNCGIFPSSSDGPAPFSLLFFFPQTLFFQLLLGQAHAQWCSGAAPWSVTVTGSNPLCKIPVNVKPLHWHPRMFPVSFPHLSTLNCATVWLSCQNKTGIQKQQSSHCCIQWQISQLKLIKLSFNYSLYKPIKMFMKHCLILGFFFF